MELKIYNPQEDGFLKQIDWNFEELKKEITKRVEPYENLVITDEQSVDGKKDIAKLRKLVKTLEDKRKEIKKQVNVPYEAFAAQEGELVEIINKAISKMDEQVKAIEQKRRDEKLQKVEELYKECIGDLDRTVPFEKIFKESWLNATTTLKSIREEITALRNKVDQELKVIITESSKYAFEMKEEYLKDYDLSAAMAVKQQLEETEKKKAIFEEQERQRKAEEEKRLAGEAQVVQAAGVRQPEQPLPKIEMTEDGPSVVYEDTKKERTLAITFRVVAKESQFDAVNTLLNQLKQLCGENFKVIGKEEL